MGKAESWRELGGKCINSIDEEIDYLIQCEELRQRIINGGTSDQYDKIIPMIKRSIMTLHYHKISLIKIAMISGSKDAVATFDDIVNGLNTIIPMAINAVEEEG